MNRLLMILLVIVAFAQPSPEIHSPHLDQMEQFGDSLFHHGGRDRSPKSPMELTHEIYGFVPYWEASYSCPRWDLVSRIAYFNFTVNSSGYVTNEYTWYTASVVDDALAAGVPVDLCIAIFDDASINTLLLSSTARGRCITNALNAVIARGGSGVNLDFELPGSGYGDELVTFCSEFRDSIDARLPGGWLSICLPAVDWRDAFFADELALYCNALFIMGYDYYWSGSSITGPCDPLDDPTETYDIDHTVDTYGVVAHTRSRLILGLPLYGKQWACSGSYRGASTTSTGTSILYTTAIANAASYGRLWDTNALSPWYVYGSYYQGWYSDPVSLRYRYQYAKAQSLLGIGWWALGYDDGAADFWAVVEEEFTGDPPVPDSSDTITIDDGDPGYSTTGGWIESSYGSSGWGADYDYASTGGTVDIAYFTPTLTISGEYNIYMHWVTGTNRATSIPVTIAGITTSVTTVNQYGTTATADWHYLGRHQFASGSSGYVSISDNGLSSGSVIIADAVRWILVSEMNVVTTESKPETPAISISPNPFNSVMNVTVDGVSPPYTMTLYNTIGKVAWKKSLSDHRVTIDMSDRPSGIYIMYITDYSGVTLHEKGILVR